MRGWTDIGTPRRCFHDDGNYRPGVGVGFPVSFSLPSPSPSPSLLPFSPFEPSLPATAPVRALFLLLPAPELLYDFSYRRLSFPRRGALPRAEERGEKEVTGEQRTWNLSFLREFLNNLLFFFSFSLFLNHPIFLFLPAYSISI